MRKLNQALAAFTVLAFGAAGFAVAQEAPSADAAAPAAEAPAQTPIGTGAGSSHIMPAPADKAQIIFFRKSGFLGAAISAHIKDGEEAIGHLANGQYFVAYVEPGKHSFSVKTEATDTLEMEVEAGETYFVEETVSMGVIVYRLNLSPSDMAAFDAVYKKIKLAKPKK